MPVVIDTHLPHVLWEFDVHIAILEKVPRGFVVFGGIHHASWHCAKPSRFQAFGDGLYTVVRDSLQSSISVDNNFGFIYDR